MRESERFKPFDLLPLYNLLVLGHSMVLVISSINLVIRRTHTYLTKFYRTSLILGSQQWIKSESPIDSMTVPIVLRRNGSYDDMIAGIIEAD
ncbi:hypothetical protein H5410_027179 [Solanum commersonii]|uniref:Uncharacterized protein n=1 Tax=Solanum commersonii TaxID=4109 RepID=A0A9J5Z185_SOLCO|nr:hypothetical protein H5410_027179 [Solanum commersonii]